MGQGVAIPVKGHRCYNCKGTGQAYSYDRGLIVCPVCSGTGKLPRKR